MTSKKYWIFLLAGTLLMALVMAVSGRPMKHPATPLGIVNLELASNATDVQNIINAWDNDISKQRDVISDAITNTWLDFIFIFFYSAFLFFSCKKLAGYFKAGKVGKKLGEIMAIAALVAGLLDMVENIGMLQSLKGNITNSIAFITASCSSIKWLLLLVIIVFLTVGFCYQKAIGKNKPGVASSQN